MGYEDEFETKLEAIENAAMLGWEESGGKLFPGADEAVAAFLGWYLREFEDAPLVGTCRFDVREFAERRTGRKPTCWEESEMLGRLHGEDACWFYEDMERVCDDVMGGR